jgi:hypothetical protein
VRPLERAYQRILLDATYCQRLAQPAEASVAGLTPEDVRMLLGFPQDTLSTERAGRQRHLLDRARLELPRTFRRAENRLPPAIFERVRAELFTDRLWRSERTLAVPLYGQGFETATHIRDALQAQAIALPDVPELVLLADLVALEHAVFALRQTGSSANPEEEEIVFTLKSSYDLFEAAEHEDQPADHFLGDVGWWYLTSSGRVGRSPVDLEGGAP